MTQAIRLVVSYEDDEFNLDMMIVTDTIAHQWRDHNNEPGYYVETRDADGAMLHRYLIGIRNTTMEVHNEDGTSGSVDIDSNKGAFSILMPYSDQVASVAVVTINFNPPLEPAIFPPSLFNPPTAVNDLANFAVSEPEFKNV